MKTEHIDASNRDIEIEKKDCTGRYHMPEVDKPWGSLGAYNAK